jgi:phage shock protein A
MALRMGALYDALRQAAGISEEDARRAAEEVANYENRIGRIEARLDTLAWMVSAVIALVMMNLAGTLTVLYRLSESSR